jgi:uncharacterized protein (DUF983 family)
MTPTPTVGTRLWRGLRKRCAVCGGGRVFESWFRMKSHCPTCATRFEREAGFFGGALFVNFAFTEIVMFAFLAIATVATLPHPNGRLLILGSVGICVVLPILLYPFSKTTWFAIHLAMEPLDPVEEAEAAATRIERGDLTSE